MLVTSYALQVADAVTSYSATDTVWVLVTAALVFFMQPGFAMVEAGFTRAKNAGNIAMKNMLDMCFATIAFIMIGFGFAFGQDVGGFIGMPTLFISNFNLDASYSLGAFIIFELVFAGTAATIVSGGMAERTKFSSYCLVSIIMCALIYPVVVHWVWGGGFLAEMGYIDFAGSTVVHMVGGITALLGAFFLGPRIGKYNKDGSANAIRGHNLTIATLGVFILWFGWFGFNGGSTLAISDYEMGELAGEIIVNTCLAAACGTVAAMCLTWIKFGHPDVTYTLNGCLAGLVGVTAGCAVVDYYGAMLIGIICGIAVVVVAEFIDKKVRIDDPVGAFAVHGSCGAIGTMLVGFLATDSGLLYGGGVHQLGVQLIGIASIAVWVIALMSVVLYVIKHTVGLRVSAEAEISGLDISEHGLVNAYSGMMPDLQMITNVPEKTDTQMSKEMEAVKGVAVEDYSIPDKTALKKVVVITRRENVDVLMKKLDSLGIGGMTVTMVDGYGAQKGQTSMYRGVKIQSKLLPKVKMEVVIGDIPVDKLINTIKETIYTGQVGDGKIFIYNVLEAVRVRTGETGVQAVRMEEVAE